MVGILARMAAGALLPRPAAAAWPPSVVGGSGCVGSAIVVAMPPEEGKCEIFSTNRIEGSTERLAQGCVN